MKSIKSSVTMFKSVERRSAMTMKRTDLLRDSVSRGVYRNELGGVRPLRGARPLRGLVFSLLLSILVLFSAGEAWAFRSVKMNMETITKQSGRIVEVVVLSAAEGSVVGPGGKRVPVMEYTLSVSASLKGKTDATIVVRHIRFPGLSIAAGGGSGVPSGFPTYKVREHLVLFLTEESQIGLSSPVGLMQGVFHIQDNEDGKPVYVVNGINNAGLFEGMNNKGTGKLARLQSSIGNGTNAASQTPTQGGGKPFPSQAGGPVSYSQFMSVVKNIVRGQ